MKTLYKKLFKLNSNGKSIQVWEIHKEADNSAYWTVSGQLEGKKTTSGKTAVAPKVKRTALEQMTLELESKITLKKRKKYVEDVKRVGKKADRGLPGYTAMLAKKWEDQKKKIEFPCLVQPKLDGIRCLATKDGLFSRGRKVIESCEHVRNALKPFFKKYPDALLDGELYTHRLKNDFESIIKAVRKSKKHTKPEDLKLQLKVQYHVYDVPRLGKLTEADPFDQRRVALIKSLTGLNISAPIIQVATYRAKNEEVLLRRHSKFLSRGYEGTMVRNRKMPYEGKRSDNLLKMKDFDEDEFQIVEVQEGKGGLVGHAATFVLKTKDGASFRAKMDGSFDRLKWLWKHPKAALGKMCTVSYQGLTNKEKVPRFPIAKAIRGLKDRSDWL